MAEGGPISERPEAVEFLLMRFVVFLVAREEVAMVGPEAWLGLVQAFLAEEQL